MKLYIRAHDLGVQGEKAIADRLTELGLDGVQLVAYKAVPDVAYQPGAITERRADEIHAALSAQGKEVALIGAYFNPVHSDRQKAARCKAVFEDYLAVAHRLGCDIVGSETGSYNDDKWTYHPMNRTDEALAQVVETFGDLAKTAARHGAWIGMEGAYGHVCYDVDRLDEAIHTIGAENIKVIFDLYNYLAMENVDQRYDILEHGLKTFAGRICVFHIKDCVITDGALKQVGVGQGIFDYEKILGLIDRYQPEAKLVLEGTTGADIEPAISHIKGILNQA